VTTTDTTEVWCFDALDTFFFKESRPLEAVGGAQLSSTFPPPARTLIGAIRTVLGDAYGVHWPDYGAQEQHALRTLMGSPDDLAPLSMQGPYLMHQGHRLYPAPLVLLQAKARDNSAQERLHFTRLRPADNAVNCDLGWVRLPQKQNPALLGAKPVEGYWLTASGLKTVLQGQTPQAHDLIEGRDLFAAEDRLGIARDAHTKRSIDGLLYQTRHVRPHVDTALAMTVHGLDATAFEHLPRQGLARLGAEGRLSAWSRHAPQALPKIDIQGQRLMLCALTHTQFEKGWLPDGFEPVTTEVDGKPLQVWHGQLANKPARLVSVVTGKPVREGGWDMSQHRPRVLQGLVCTGSCYFFELDSAEDARHVAQAMHGAQWGQDTRWGRGQVGVGLWH